MNATQVMNLNWKITFPQILGMMTERTVTYETKKLGK